MPAGTNAQPWLGIRLILADDLNLDLTVEVTGPYIVVRTPSGSFRATYVKSPAQLVLGSEWFSNGREHPIELARLRARAWRLANDKAAELGWFSST